MSPVYPKQSFNCSNSIFLPDLATVLIEAGVLSRVVLNEYHDVSSGDLFSLLLKKNIVTESILHEALAEYSAMTRMRISDVFIDSSCTTLIERAHQEKNDCIPLFFNRELLVIGVSNPYIMISSFYDAPYEIILIPQHDIRARLQIKQGVKKCYQDFFRLCIEQHGSDIHFFSTQNGLDVFFRVQGEIVWVDFLSKNELSALIQQIKLDAHLNVSSFGFSQDGRMTFYDGKKQVYVRVSVIPTFHGEDIVCRLFQYGYTYKSFNDLGFKPKHVSFMNDLLSLKQGLILVTGPTGSGKTTTLYTLLHQMKTLSKKIIITLEDPVEMELDGIRQCPVKPESDFNFSTGLKAILRQDPDVIMLGEIRDAKTAEIALNAAYSGHLVLSSLHTADVESTLLRLNCFQLDPFLLTQSLQAIISQRLVPVPCDCVHLNYAIQKQCSCCNGTGIARRQVLLECYRFPADRRDLLDCGFDTLKEKGVYFLD